jgi:hypothetical protein
MNKRTTRYCQQLQRQLDDCGKMPIFEIPVARRDNGERDWVIVDIAFCGRSIVGQREAVSSREERSKYIASTRCAVQDHWSLDDALQELMAAVQQDIIDGNRFDLGHEQ